MKFGIIGSGKIGSTLAKLLIDIGEDVAIANSRGPESMTDLVSELGDSAQAMSVEDAMAFGDWVILAVPLKAVPDLPTEPVKGKLVIDVCNYYPDRDGEIDLGSKTSSEWVAKHFADSQIVKAYNTIHFQQLAEQGDKNKPIPERRAIFVAGDDAIARQNIMGLTMDLGFGPVGCGELENSVEFQPGAPVYNVDMTQAEGEAKMREKLGLV